MSQDVTAILDFAIDQHQAGNIEQAEQAYRSVLSTEPDQADALNLLGVLLQDKGHLGEAISLLERAVNTDPEFPEALTNLARAKRAAGAPTEAAALAQKSIGIDPGSPESFLQLGLAYYDLGRFEAALEPLEKAAKELPHAAGARFAVANTKMALNDPAGAIGAFQAALQIDPNHFEALLNVSMCYLMLGKRAEARNCQVTAAAIQPDNPAIHASLALTHQQAGEIDASLSACRTALALNPDHHDALVLAGTNLLALGQLEDAENSFRRALEVSPDSVAARSGLASMSLGWEQPDDENKLAQWLADTKAPWFERATAGFTLGSLLDRNGRYGGAFHAYQNANAVVHAARSQQGRRFDADGLRAYVEWAMAAFNPALFRVTEGWGDPTRRPVFIVGMPRSGTTLVEQIVASHSNVFGAGEMRSLPFLVQSLDGGSGHRSPLVWDRERIKTLTRHYDEQLCSIDPSAARIVDKLPDNIQIVGQILVMFPNASIIICRRDMRDVCLSCYFQNFQDGSEWTFDLGDCVTRAELIDRLTGHWLKVAPAGRILEANYEDILTDLEGQSRRLIRFLGLEWDSACLEFDKTRRTVKTASQWQVRQPLYRTSRGRWRHYHEALEPFRDRFDVLERKASDAEAEPNPAREHADLAQAYFIANELGAAERLASEAIARDPTLSEGHMVLGAVLSARGRNEEASVRLQKSLDLASGNLESLILLGTILSKLNLWDTAAQSRELALTLAPDNVQCLVGLAHARFELGQFPLAVKPFERLAELQPDNAYPQFELARFHFINQDPVAAEPHARRAIELDAGKAEHHVCLGDCLSALGHFDDAMASYKAANRIDPSDATALGALIKAGQSEDPALDLRRLDLVFGDEAKHFNMRAAAGFALADAMEKSTDYDKAFEYLKAANELVKTGRKERGHVYDRGGIEKFVSGQIAGAVPSSLDAISHYGDPSDVPVFIVGLPRSGTSLVEQILSSHPDVYGLGETKNIDAVIKELTGSAVAAKHMAWLPSETRDKAAEMLSRMRAPMPSARRVIDKMPDNLNYLGQIMVLFPNARIISCVRDPRDTGLSCFFQNFADGLPWTFDLADIGYHIYQMERLRLHWRHVLPLRMLEVRYERLVEDLENESRRIVDFLDLPWDPACLSFHTNRRQVVTASVWQVRRPLYTSSVGRWRNYRRHLGPMIANLRGLVADD